jgi:phospholipid-binding lipoprotein MlaA
MKPWRLILAAAGLVVLSGCATVGPAGAPGTAPVAAPHPADPWEAWNRKVYAFNDAIDVAVVKPVATAYRDIVPPLVRTGVSNFFGNIDDAWSAANHLLQGKMAHGLEMGFRVLTNTLMGFAGVLDPATEFGMQRRSEDFGQTLGAWGVGAGPYVMLPLLGPSTLRDSAALIADRQMSASDLAHTSAGAAAVTTLEIVNLRANLLNATALLDRVALDRYSFLRDAHLQRRQDAVHDGAAPMVDEFADEPTTSAPGPKAGKPRSAPAAKPATPKQGA